MRLQYIEAGEIVTTHGVRGELKVLPWLDSPEDLMDFDRVKIDDKEYTIENCRVQKTCNLVKLQGIDTVEDAQALRGKTVNLYRCDISDAVIFAAELLNINVYADGELIGIVTDVLDYPGNKVYVIKGEHEYMIPAVKQFVNSIDIDANSMHVQLIEGMRLNED